MGQRDLDRPIGKRDEGRDLAVAVDYKTERRRLHATDGKNALIAGIAAEQREQSAQIHADEPVGPRTCESRMIERQRLGTGLERVERLADGSVVEGRQPQTLDRAAIAAQVENLAGDHFALAIGVGGDHQFGRLADQILHDPELRGPRRFDVDAPGARCPQPKISTNPLLFPTLSGLTRTPRCCSSAGMSGFDRGTTGPEGFQLGCSALRTDVPADRLICWWLRFNGTNTQDTAHP